MGKDLFLLALFFATSIFLFSFSAGKPSAISVKKLENNLAKINERLYVYKYETSNGEYRQFLDYLQRSGQSDLYQTCLIDSNQWAGDPYGAEPMKQQYHRNKQFDNYPVVNISHEAAMAYCYWLTEQYNLDGGRRFRRVQFRLPTETEWVALANAGISDRMYPWNSQLLRDRDGRLRCNFRAVGDQMISRNHATGTYQVVNESQANWKMQYVFTVPVNSFEPMGPYGLFNLSGNAAEMLEESGIAKGGSYNSGGYDVRIQSRMHYEGPNPEIGFRVIMEVEEE